MYYILAAGADGCFRFWEHETRSLLPDRWATVENLGMDKAGFSVSSRISAAAASKSRDRLAVAHVDGSITVWHDKEPWMLGLERESALRGHEELIHTMEFSPNAKLLVSASHGSVKIWQVRGGMPVAVLLFPGGGIPRPVAFSPDSASLASTLDDGSIRLWDAEDLQSFSDIQDHLDRAQRSMFSANDDDS